MSSTFSCQKPEVWSWSPWESGFWPRVSWSLSFEGDSDYGLCQSHLDFCEILLLSIWLLCNLSYNWSCLYTIMHYSLEEFKNYSKIVLKQTIIMSHNKSYSRSPKFSNPTVGVTQKTTLHPCKKHCRDMIIPTRCSAIAERPRCGVGKLWQCEISVHLTSLYTAQNIFRNAESAETFSRAHQWSPMLK